MQKTISIALKKECEKIINSNKYEKSILKLAEKFCVTPISIKDLIKNHRVVLNSESSKEETPELWNKKVDDYFKQNAKNKITETTLTSLDSSNQKSNRDKLKSDCKKIENKNNHEKNFHDIYSQFEEWCTIPK